MRAIRRSFLTTFQSWRERRPGRRELAAMSERELRDIGLYPADIADEIGSPFWRDTEGKWP